MEAINAIQKLRHACQLSDTYNSHIWIFHNEYSVFLHPTLANTLGLPEVIKYSTDDYKSWMIHRSRFYKILDQEIHKDCDEYPCIREVS